MEIDMCPNSGKVAQHIFESLRAVDNIYKYAWISIKSTLDVSNIVYLTGMDVLDQYIWSKNHFKQKMVEFRVYFNYFNHSS